jgi:hypothetical protein
VKQARKKIPVMRETYLHGSSLGHSVGGGSYSRSADWVASLWDWEPSPKWNEGGNSSCVWDCNRPDAHPNKERRDLRRAGGDAVCMSLGAQVPGTARHCAASPSVASGRAHLSLRTVPGGVRSSIHTLAELEKVPAVNTMAETFVWIRVLPFNEYGDQPTPSWRMKSCMS